MTSYFYDEKTGHLKLSWSRIRTWEECSEKGWHVGHGRKSPVADATVFYKGNVVDQAMRQWLSQPTPEPGWMRTHVEQIFDTLEVKIREDKDGTIRWKHGQREAARTECVEAVTRLEPLLQRFALPYYYQPAVRFETTIMVPSREGELRPVILHGEMDLLVSSVQRTWYRIWDLKMTKDDQYWRKTVAQLVFYDIAVLCKYGMPAAEVGLLQPMVDGTPYISYVPSEEDRTQMFSSITRTADAIWHEEHSPKANSDGCSRCETRHACSRYVVRPGTNEIQLF